MPARGLRLDLLLVQRGLVETRSKARALILAGRVFRGDERLDKAGVLVAPDAPLRVAEGRRWVGRGGDKLDPVLDTFDVRVAGRGAIDVGASTGGFTHVLLTRGAARVIALDVGRGQLDWGLRNDARVHVLEGVNARRLAADDLPYAPDLAVVDVSFISLALVVPPVAAALAPGAELVTLIKPQFEVGRGQVGRGGIVRDPAAHRDVLARFRELATTSGLGVIGVTASPIRGAEGNREFFAHLRPGAAGLDDDAFEERLAAALADDAREDES